MARSPSRLPYALLAATVLLAVLTRLPQFLGGHMLVDGDESVLGLMAKHLSEGRRVPIFLYGQAYGLAIVEAAVGALAFKLAGVSSEALKAGLLALWSLGAVFLVLAAERWRGRRAALALALALALCPGWAAWSLKARGGYVTAFVASSAALWLLAGLEGEVRGSRSRWLWLGVLSGTTALAQPIALVALLPFLAAAILPAERRRPAALLFVAAFVTVAAAVALSRLDPAPIWLPRLFEHPDPVSSLTALPRRLWVSLSGLHFFGQALEPGPWTAGATALWAMALLGLGAQAVLSLRARVYADPAVLALAGVLCACGFSLLVTPRMFAHQYLFPVPGLLALGTALALGPWLDTGGLRRAAATVGLTGLLGLGSGALWEFGGVSLCGFQPAQGRSEPELMRLLLERLEDEGIGHVYCDGSMLQWTITFTSRERILARWKPGVDRVPQHAAAVDAALRAGRPVALVYGERESDERPAALRDDPRWFSVGGRFLVLPHVTLETVRAAGFRMSHRPPPPR